MRTTVDIPDVLYQQLRIMAAREGRSIKELIVRAIEADFKRMRRPQYVSLRLAPSKNRGTLVLDNAKIFDLIPFP